MAFKRPTLPELIARAQADLESRVPGSSPALRRTMTGVLARILPAIAHGLYGHLDWLSDQILPDTAEAEILDRHASIWGIDRKPAAAAAGSITVTGTDGAVIPAGTTWQRADGTEYASEAEAVIAGGTAAVSVTAGEPGSAGNADAGVSLTLVNPIGGVQSAATVGAEGLTGGTDTETDSALRSRVIARIQSPPHGGTAEDYEAWALEVSGVTRAWVYPAHLGVGTVGVAFVMDDQAGSIIPDAAMVNEVQDHLDDLRPVTADLTVFAPTPVSVDFTIQVTPNTSAVQAAVKAELEDLLRREAEPGGTLRLSHIREAISIAAGETDHVLVAPAADVVFAAGELAIMGVITWQ